MKKKKNSVYGIVIPAANEEKTIKKFTLELIKEITKLSITAKIFFVVDTVSKDNTIHILKKIAETEKMVHVIYEPKNKNVVDAYIRGYREALKEKCDFAIDMDCGFSHLPKELSLFVNAFEQGYECVFGIRPLLSVQYTVPFKRRLFSLGGTLLGNILLKTHYKDLTSGYVGYSNKTLTSIVKKPLRSIGHFWHTEMRYRAKNYHYIEVPITYNFPSNSVRWNIVKNALQTLITLSIEERKRKTSN